MSVDTTVDEFAERITVMQHLHVECKGLPAFRHLPSCREICRSISGFSDTYGRGSFDVPKFENDRSAIRGLMLNC